MSAPKVLFIGGSGVISTACAWEAVARGIDLHVLNRGVTTSRRLPDEVRTLTADVRDRSAVAEALGDQEYDAVVDWVAFTPEHVAADIEQFTGRTGQYVFISSASAYQTPPARLPVVESTPLHNPIWRYSQDKIACEDMLVAAYRESGFPMTVIRPSHTYDKTLIPLDGAWTLTHSRDFAKGFVPLLGHPRTLGEAFHITSDDVLTWDQITHALGAALGVEPQIVHVTSDAIAAADPEWGASLLGDKTHSLVFDTTKLRRLVPDFAATTTFEQGAREIAAWYLEDPSRQQVDEELDALMDRLAARATAS
jgi:nucleoside-diphosphate-sugar epimerase